MRRSDCEFLAERQFSMILFGIFAALALLAGKHRDFTEWCPISPASEHTKSACE